MAEPRSAIVTGCSRGIGRTVTEMLLAEGWEVLGISRTPPDFPTRPENDYCRFGWVEWDLGQHPDDYEQPKPGYMTGPGPYHPSQVLTEAQGEYDALVHCAGIRGPYGPFTENDPEAWAETIRVNLLGTARIVRAALPLLQRSEDARILLFSGGGAFGPEPSYSAYAASKGGTVSLMETLAMELADTAVTVNAIAPGFISTGIHKGTPHEGRPDSGVAMTNAVNCVRHLLSPQARGMTGRTVSAQHDAWNEIEPWTMPYLGDQGTRTRLKIEHLRAQMIRRKRAI